MTYRVKLVPLNKEIECEEDEPILDAALRQGVRLAFGCRDGQCASCKARILEGEVDYGDYSPFALMDFEKEEGYVLLCQATPLEDLVIEATKLEADELPGEYRGRIGDVVTLTYDTKSFLIQLVDPPSIGFRAGQYIDVFIPGAGVTRSYSISSPPSRPQAIEIVVRYVPGGVGSGYLHRLHIGDEIRFSGPYGESYLREDSDREVIFVAGASGIGPIRSMLLHAFEKRLDERRKMTLFFGVRRLRDLYYDEEFSRLEREHPNFRFVPALSEAGDPQWTGEVGLITEVMNKYLGDRSLQECEAYLAGPPAMIDAAILLLRERGIPTERIRFDKFTSRTT